MAESAISLKVPEACRSAYQHNADTTLLRLPGELRNEIYKLVLSEVLRPKDTQLRETCRQMYHEAFHLAREARPEDIWCEAVHNDNFVQMIEEVRRCPEGWTINLHIKSNGWLSTATAWLQNLDDMRLPDIITIWNPESSESHTGRS